MIQHLLRHGCPDLTGDLGELGAPELSEYPLGFHASGHFGDVWMLRTKDGHRVAVKYLKSNTGSDEDARRLTVSLPLMLNALT